MEKIQKNIAVMLLCLLQLAVGHVSANAQTSTGIYSITVNTPGTFGQVMLQTVDNWSDVVELTISGHLNSSDMSYFSRMQNITKLDVSKTDISSITGCNGLSLLKSIILPETVTTIDDNAFSGCSSLSTFALNNIESIGSYAFSHCDGLTGNITGLKVRTIGSYAFYRCDNIESISFPVVEEIGESAFESDSRYNKLSSAEISSVKYVGGNAFAYCSSLKSIDLRNCEELGNPFSGRFDGCFIGCTSLTVVSLSDKLTEIPNGCFLDTGLQQIELPINLTSIGDYAFYGSKLSIINIPEGVKTIGYEAFCDCPLESITLPSTLESIDGKAFYSDVLKDVYCKSVVPIVTSAFNNAMVKAATLHVPTFSVSAYKLDDNWYKFNKIVAIEGDLTDVTINNTFTIIDYSGLANNANITLTSVSSDSQEIAGHLSVSGESVLSLNNYVQEQNFEYKNQRFNDDNGNSVYIYTYPYCTTLIADSEIRANNVTTKIKLPTNRWSFISMPYDVNVSSIVAPEGTMWVVRKYNGFNRAAMTGDTWENVTSGQMLNAGEGYIFHCVKEDTDNWNTEYVEFEFRAINNSNKNNLFIHEDVVTTINEYPAEFPHNRGWNLIGNPYPSFLSSQYVDFPAPITIWNGNGYTAYSLADDEYMLRPNEAFFVQCPINTNQIKFSKGGRSHDYLSSPGSNNTPSRAMSSGGNRSILNIMLGDDDFSDRTRLVLNDEASGDYEIDKDASKFMSNNESVPQIFIVDNGISYAINERPLGDGVFSLGVRIGAPGNYRISMNAKDWDYDVLLTDKDTKEITNLTQRSYSFTSGALTSNDRFSLTVTPNGGLSSIEDVSMAKDGFAVKGNMVTVEPNTPVKIHSIDGKIIYNGVLDSSIQLHQGMYILSINNATHKIVIK